MNRRLHTCAAALFVLLTAGSRPVEAQARHILVLQSFDRGNLTLDSFTGDFRVDVERRSRVPVTFTQAVVNLSGFDVSPEKLVVDYLLSLFAQRSRPDLVVTIGGPAAVFARKYRQQLFPASPLLFAAVDQRFVQRGSLADNETMIAAANDMAAVVDDILQLFPDTSNVFVVLGSGPHGRFWRRELDRDLERFRGRVTFTWSDELTLTGLLNRVATLPPRSAVYFLSFGTDTLVGAYAEDRVLADIHAAANAPLFGVLNAEMGHGIIGGTLMDMHEVSRQTADVALRVLNGELPADIDTPAQKPGPRVFDWRELRRWHVSDSRLPAGSVVLFRQPGVWERFKWLIIAGASALIAQALLIGGLLVHRAKRRRAEQSLRENVADLKAARGALSNLSRQLMKAQEQERSRLARELHDDLSQKMSFLAMDLARLRDTLPEDDAEARTQVRGLQDAVRTLGRDVQGISHRLHSSRLDYLGLSEASGRLCREMATRHGLDIEYAHDQVPAELGDGVAISLFRVLQEALSNSVKHSGAHRCAVTLRGTDGMLKLDVVDDGRGFDAAAARRGNGLGLISMQERLSLVDGAIVVESRPGAGTAIRATVPLPTHGVVNPQAVSSSVGGMRSTSA
jgi:signal transduction histidine kinase